MSTPDLLAVSDVDADLAWQRRGGLEWLGPEHWYVVEADASRGRLHLDAVPGSLMVTTHAGAPSLSGVSVSPPDGIETLGSSSELELDNTDHVAWRGKLPNGLGSGVVFDTGQWRLAIVARGTDTHTRIGVFCAEREAFEAHGGVMMLATVMTSLHKLAA